jgi:hypothetical protein
MFSRTYFISDLGGWVLTKGINHMGNESPKGPFFYMQIKEVWLLKSWRSQEAMSSLQLNPRCATKLVSSLLSVLSSEAYYIELPLSLVPVYVSELTCMHGLRKKRKRVRGRNPTFRTSTHILFSRHKILKALVGRPKSITGNPKIPHSPPNP